MKEKLLGFLRQFKWWEYLYMGVFLTAIIVCGIIFKSGPIVILSSLLGVVGVFFIAKGKLIGNFIAIAQGALYITMSYFNRFYGEMIVCGAVTIPSYIIAIYTWMKNSSKKDKVVKINKGLSKLEWGLFAAVSACAAVGAYFMLRAFNTANLLVSTFSVLACAMAGYLSVRRCEYNFIFYILSNIVCICLWMFVIVKDKDVSYIPTILQYSVFLFLNIMGMANWIKIKKIQSMKKKVIKRKAERLRLDNNFLR